MSPAIEVRKLTVGYRNRRKARAVASNIDAVARQGELTVLLGPNGCGKSTLIHTLCGLRPPLDGQVLIDGTDLAGLASDERARRVGVVLTERIDPGLLSVRELVGMGRIPHLGLVARLSADDHAVVNWALAAVNTAQLAERPAAELSDGERQRVFTARALAQQPSVLILDEPTSFLDVPSRAALAEVLRGLAREQGLAIVMSTHDLELALRVADRVWLLGPDGTLVDTIPEEVSLSGRIGALFDCGTLRFDPTHGVFVVRNKGGRNARLDASNPLRGALERMLAREGWEIREPAEIVITASGAESIAVRSNGGRAASATLHTLPALLRTLPIGDPTRRIQRESHRDVR